VVDYQALVEQQSSFEAVAAYTRALATLTSSDVADRVPLARVTPGFFDLLGIDVLAGREALDEDGVPGARPTIVVTPGFADRYLGVAESSADAIDDLVTLDGVDYRVVGVIPDDHGPIGSTVGAFPTLQLDAPERKGPFGLSVFGRLAVDPAVAEAELRAINDRLFPLWADSYQDEAASWGMMDLEVLLMGDTDRLVVALMSSVALLLFMATTNAANLLVARVAGRRRELAVRVAVGASRARVMGYLLTESAILALGGMAVGLAVSWGAIEVMPGLASGYIPRLAEVGFNGPVIVFAGLLSLGSGALFGLISALSGSAGDIGANLRAGGRASSRSMTHQRAQRTLVITQLAVAVPLLVGAGVLVSSFVRLSGVDPGFDAQQVVSVRVTLAESRYPDRASRQLFWDQLVERMESAPGVTSLGVASGRPPLEVAMINNFDLEDRPTAPDAAEPAVPWLYADNGYFETLDLKLTAGRLFNPSDLLDGPPVVIVDEAWADRFFPGEEVVGRRMVSGGCTTCPLTTVIGVIETVPYLGIRRIDEGAVYSPGARAGLTNPVLHIRTAGDPLTVAPIVREEIRLLDSTIPLSGFTTGDDLLSNSLTQPRQLSLLLGAFSALGKGDIAVRLALGGAPSDVLRSVIQQGVGIAMIGLVIGVAGALTFTRVLSGFLFEVTPNDPLTLVAVSALLLGVSIVACGLPGRRAHRIDPATALREE
jgi:putative ABC transport system permease protein